MASAGPVTSTESQRRQLVELGAGGGDVSGGSIHVFRPSTSLYSPLALYPLETTGGMLQQASLWPWLAGIVDMLAIGDIVGLDEARFVNNRGDDGRNRRMLDSRRV